MTENTTTTPDTTTPKPEAAAGGPCPTFWDQHACCLDADHGRKKHLCACGAKPGADDTLVGDDLHLGTPYAEGHR